MEGYRLSPQQRRQWRLRGGAMRVACLLRIEGELQSGALERALAGLVEQHEILRTTFVTLSGMDEPVQVIAPSAAPEWNRMEAGGVPAPEREARAREHFLQASERPFDLAAGPMLRVTLATLDERRHLLGLVVPAICADAATLRLLSEELQRRYAGTATPAEEPSSYLAFSEWQNELLTELATSPAAAFWETHAPGPQAAVVLPLERKAATPAAYHPASLALRLEENREAKLDAAAAAMGCDPESLLLATWSALQWKLTGQTELVVGLSSHGREHPELADTSGPLSRWLPLRSRFHADQPLKELARQLQQARNEALEWQRYFVWPAQGGEPVAGRDYPAIGFRWESRRQAAPQGPGAFRVELEQAHEDRSKLCLSCTRTAYALELELQYDMALLSGESARQMLEQLEALLEQCAANPELTQESLEPLGARERERLLVDFNATKAELPPRCLHEWMAEHAARHPERTAVVFEDRSLTYAQLEKRANQLAHALRRRGVGPEVRVGLCLDRSLEVILGIVGVFKSGGAYVPLDPGQPRQRLLNLLEDVRAPVILTERRLLKAVPPREGCEVLCLDDEDLFAQEPEHAPVSGVTPEHPAYVLFTSGSTGRPKGVIVEHRQLHNYVASVMERLALPEGASYASVSTFSADLGNTVVFPALCNGSTLHVISAERASDPIALAEYTRRHPIDCLKIVPSHLRALLSAGNPQAVLPRQRLILGGEATPRAWAEQLQSEIPGCRIYNHYGPTETTVGVLTFWMEPGRAFEAVASLPLARPVANTRIYVLDARLRPVPVGVTGEIYVSGAALARGYLDRPDLTAQAFLPDPFSTSGERMYRTGDLGRHLPDGTVEHLGRADNQVKYHGYRIELAELRLALNKHPQVRDSVVMLKKDANGNDVLAAYYVARQEIDRDQLRAFLSEHVIDEVLPNVYVHLKKLPLTLNGKVNYEALPSLEEARQRQRTAVVAPRTPVETTLAGIWCQVLNLKEVSVTDNFFSIGGDSILGILVISKANQAGLKLNPRQLFQHQTIAELASVAIEATATASTQEGPVTGPLRLTPIQHWFFDQGMPDPDAWCVVVPLEAKQALDVTKLEQALTALLHHHDMLRLRVVRGASGWEASIAPPEGPMPLERLDLSQVPDAALPERFQKLGHELQARLRLAGGPTLVATWLELGPHRPGRLMIAAHRLVIDGVSWRVLFEHLQLAYQQLVERGECALPPRTTSLKAWTERLHEYAASPKLHAELPHWLEANGSAKPLPVDRPDAKLPLTLDQEVTNGLTAEESRALVYELPEAYRCEMGELLIAALTSTLCGWSGHPSLTLDVEGHGREDVFEGVDLSQTVGWFTSLYPVRLTPDAGGQPGATVRAVKEQLRAVPNRGLGYGVLRYLSEDASVRERLASLPEAEVHFRYVGQYNLGSSLLSVLDQPEPQAPTRKHKLAVVARLVDGQLHLSWFHGSAMYQRSTIEGLAARYLDTLRRLLTERGNPEQPVLAPSDFPLAGLDQQKLDKLLSRLKK